ncbi:MAG TPA: hypothetical protein VH916_14525, partial [Dehalococcoidia bacterium]
MRQHPVRRSLGLLPALCLVLALALACGSGGSSKNNKGSRGLSQPQNAPTATLPATLPSPIAASSVTGSSGTSGPS